MAVTQVWTQITITDQLTGFVITDIVEITNGFRVTLITTTGLSNWDFVDISGSTNYNHAFEISNLTGTTFDCVAQRYTGLGDETSISASATQGYIDPSGLIGLSGVTTHTSGGITFINVGSNKLVLETAMRIDPRNYCIISNVGDAAFVVKNGGQLYFGKPLSKNNYYYSYPMVAYINTASPALFWQPWIMETGEYGALSVIGSTSALYWEHSVLQFTTFGSGTAGNAVQFIQDANIFIRGGILNGRAGTASNGFRTANLDIEDLELWGTETYWWPQVVGYEPTGLKLSGCGSGMFGNKGDEYNWRDLNISNKGNTVDMLIWTDYGSVSAITQQHAINNSSGNNIRIGGVTSTAQDRAKGRNTVKKEVIVQTLDDSGNDIDGAKAFTRDTNNGHRKNLNSIDDTADKTYTDTTSSGKTGTMTVTTNIVNVASSTSTPAGTDPITLITPNTGVIRYDFRGKSDTTIEPFEDDATQAIYDETAKFDFIAVKYGKLVSSTTALLSGNGTLLQSMTMLEDSFVVLSEGSASALIGIALGARIEAQTISFTSNNTISDSAWGFGSFSVGDRIRVRGSLSNDGEYTIATVSVYTITTNETTITTESAGYSVRIYNAKVIVSSSHTISEVYDYLRYDESQNPDVVWDNDNTHILSTGDWVSHTSIYDIEVNGSWVILTWSWTLSLWSNTLSEVSWGVYNWSYVDSTWSNIDISNANILPGSSIRLYNVTQDIELDIQHNIPSWWYSIGVVIWPWEDVESWDIIRLDAMKSDWLNHYKYYTESATATISGISYTGSQELWQDAIDIWYDWSIQTEFTLDWTNIHFDISSPDWKFKVWEALAWALWATQTDDGMRKFFWVLSYKWNSTWEIDTDKSDVFIDNLQAHGISQSDLLYIQRKDLLYPVVWTTTWGGSISLAINPGVFWENAMRSAMDSQWYTSDRWGNLDNLDAKVSKVLTTSKFLWLK